MPDHDRPLAGRGRKEAPLAGRWLNHHYPDIDLAVVSTAKRARQTWSRVAEEFGTAPAQRFDERLYATSVDVLVSVAQEFPDTARTVLIIGHNPGLEDLASELTGTQCALKTSSVAVLSGPGDWLEIGPGWATLEATETPRP